MVNLLFLDLLGGVALLLWGLHMVHSGVVRAFGSDLRHLLNVALRNRFSAFLAGILVTALLQSSTATGLMTTSFAAGGLVALVPALAIMLGANVGTALIVQVLSFNVSAVAPVLLLVGIIAFRRGGRTRTRDLGRVAIGLGLMLLALHILLDTLAPAEQAPQVHELFAVFTSQPIVCVFLAAILTWAAHSSVAVVLLVMSLAYSHFITPVGALALVLGANLGSAINPVLEGSKSADPASRRVPIGNLLNRVIGVAATLPLLPQIVEIFGRFQLDPARMTAEFHLAFNVALALIFIGLLDGMAWLLMRILPEQKKPADPAAPLYLDETAIDTPSVALACAARETLHMGDIVETMLRDSITAVMADDRKAAKKIKHRYQFSKEGAAELVAFHQRTLDNLKLAFGVFMSGDIKVARKLLAEKAALREAELSAAENHLARLREGRPESIETSSLHLDILRDLKRIHSHICSVAYPVLETAGELEPSRLKRTDDVLALPDTLSVTQSSQPPTEQAS